MISDRTRHLLRQIDRDAVDRNLDLLLPLIRAPGDTMEKIVALCEAVNGVYILLDEKEQMEFATIALDLIMRRSAQTPGGE
jgi:hypothetical protein